MTDPTSSYGYDPAGNLLSSEDAHGVTTTIDYTPLNQIQSIFYSDSTPTVSDEYDADGNRLR